MALGWDPNAREHKWNLRRCPMQRMSSVCLSRREKPSSHWVRSSLPNDLSVFCSSSAKTCHLASIFLLSLSFCDQLFRGEQIKYAFKLFTFSWCQAQKHPSKKMLVTLENRAKRGHFSTMHAAHQPPHFSTIPYNFCPLGGCWDPRGGSERPFLSFRNVSSV